MPYHTNWKDGRLVESNQRQNFKDTPNPLKNHGTHLVEKNLLCLVCNLPHTPEYYIGSKTIQ